MTTSSRPVAPVVALDIGNVCVTLDQDRAARMLGFAGIAAIPRECPDIMHWTHQLETGRVDAREFARRIAPLTRTALAEDEILAALCILIAGEMPGMAEVVAEAVANGYRCVFLSDIAAEQYAHVRGLLSFADLVPEAVVSYEEGATKPADPMYAALEARFCAGGVPAIYTDDRLENIAAAHARGWHAVPFTTTADFHAALRALGPATGG